jgi:hypothetical protein
MKPIFLILGIIAGILAIPVHAQTTSEFGYQLHPEKLLENTEGILQVFVTSNELMLPKAIKDLKTISSDNAVIQILAIEDGNNEFTKNIMIKARKPGIATIALAAPGFTSKEISLEVFNNNNYPTQIIMKITPETFPIDGPKFGYIALELTTTGGLPTLASEDMTIHLETPNNDIIKLKNSEITISSGKYYAITEFEIVGSGNAIIFAETEGMKKISEIVGIFEANGPLKLKLNIYPENYNSFSVTAGVAIVQLLDNEDEPILADEDIHFKLSVEDPNTSVNTSYDFDEVSFSKQQLVIEKGSYTAFTKFTPKPNLGDFTESSEQEYNMFISAENYLTESDSFTVHHDQLGALEGEGPSVTEVLPFLTTGKQEIIAVTYYETDILVSRQTGGSAQGATNRDLIEVTVPVQASNDHKIIFSSSDLDVVNPIDPMMKKGQNVVIVFGETGTISSEDDVEFYITDNEGIKTAISNPIGPIEDDISLIVEPLVPVILAENEFPVLVYLVEGVGEEGIVEVGEDEDGDPRLGVTPFIKDAVLTFSVDDLVETDSITIKQNQPYALMNMMSNEVGTTSLSYQMGGFDGDTDIVSTTTDPTDIYLAFPKNILANSKTLTTIQLLDSSGNPVYAKKDIEITLVSNDETILKTSQEITVRNGEYFTTFDLEGINEGEIELAILSEDFALVRYDINVVDITPELTLNLLGGMNWNERIEAKLSVTIPEITTALDGFIVEWETDGGEVVGVEEITNREGIAILNIIANDKATVSVTATVSGNGLSSAVITKTGEILNVPIVEIESVSDSEVVESEVLLDTNTLILIIIPVAVGAVLFLLKRMDKLDMITERIPIGDKIEEIKERISDIRNR